MKQAICVFLVLMGISGLGHAQAPIAPPNFQPQLDAIKAAGGNLQAAVVAEIGKLSTNSQNGIAQAATSFYNVLSNSLSTFDYNTVQIAKAIAAEKLNDYNQQAIDDFNRQYGNKIKGQGLRNKL